MADLLRTIGPLALALACAWVVDRECERRRLFPPLFGEVAGEPRGLGPARRVAASLILAMILWIGVFAPLGSLGTAVEFDPAGVATSQLFLLHALLVLCIASWYVLGFGFDGRRWPSQFGLVAGKPAVEIVIGIGAGAAAWVLVIVVMIASAILVWLAGGRELLPETAPAIVPWLAGLPLGVRLGVSASAGISEELFFRGFLQPRTGVLVSTALFVLAHLSYDQPFMLIGVTLLSLVFALLVRWRQNIWAAVAAHATFDAIQLAIVIPWALRHLESGNLPLAELFN